MSYAVSERMTWTGLGKQLKLVNMLFGCTVVPETTYKLRKLWSSKTNKLVKYHYLCPSCGTVLDTDCTHARCSACLLEETTTKLKREGSYFLMLDLHDQLEHLIAKTKDELHSSLLDITSSSNDVITDITTGEAYKRLRQEVPLSPNDITITFNTDGSPIFKSSKTSVWPIQFTVNELPPSVRLHHSTLAGLWFGKCHPDMSAFMEKFVDEVNNMTPVTWMHGDHSHTSKAFVLCCSVDAPARAAVQNMVLFNGFFGCPWCLMKGEHEEGCVRYVSDEAPAPRTSELVARDMVLALRLGSPGNGIKGPSALMNLEGGTYAEAATRGAAPPLKASVGTQYSPRDFECSTSPPTPSEAPAGSQTPAAPPKLPRTKTMPHRLGPKPRVVLDATPSRSSEGPTPSTSQREEEAMEVSVDLTEPPPLAKGGTKSAPEKGDQKKKLPRVTAPTNAS
ncbi:hypothetical protein HPB47_021436 [Ixodes persulcatus]|uniref:Uncharacterized protein n=1 Tax=Ixodes persulcatus TaxID=34615 RepID=A0AC60QFT1_IXOPE|nr:hypothetical protein HPB47_021436 [Ixodes persulcatus]